MTRTIPIILFCGFFQIPLHAHGIASITKVIESAIIERYDEVFVVHNKATATHRIEKTIRVLNKKGEDAIQPFVVYDKLVKVKEFQCTLYDASGQVIKKFKKSEIIDESLTSGGTIYDDNRIKYVDIENNRFPYIVHVVYETDLEGLYAYPIFKPQNSDGVRVNESSFSVEIPEEMHLRFKCNFPDSLPLILEQDGKFLYQWRLNNLIPQSVEVLAPSGQDFFPTIYVAPNEFEYDGYAGSMQSWRSMGRWLYSLLKGRSSLDPGNRDEILAVASTKKSIPEKVEVLYKYLQSKTRYVSIQLGIGGYQPFAAQTVADLGYGDCKALSNYMRCILDVAGIPSYYTVIGAGRGYPSFTFTDFPNPFHANHVILTVPMENDTIFLECTSQKNACGYLGSFTSDRNALLVGPDGGHLIRTPKYALEQNLRHSKGKYEILSAGHLVGDCITTYHALASESVESLPDLSGDEQRKEFLRKNNLPGLEIEAISYQSKESSLPTITEDLSYMVSNYLQIAGPRIFLRPNVLNRWSYVLPDDEERTQPIQIAQDYYELDTTIFRLPKEYKLEAPIETTALETPYGSYGAKIELKDGKIMYYRQFKLYKQTYSKVSYPNLRNFLRHVMKSDNSQLVLIQEK